MRPFILGGRGYRHDMVLTRIECGRGAADRTALAGRIVALEHRDQCMALHVLVTQVARQPGLFSDQLGLVLVLFQRQAQVQAVKQGQVVVMRSAWSHRQGLWLDLRGLERGLHAFEQQATDRQAAVVGIHTLDHMPGAYSRLLRRSTRSPKRTNRS